MECRMMKIQQLIPYLALWFICSSCWSEGDKVTWFYTDSYVYQYVRYDEIVLRAGSFGEVAVQVNDNGFYGVFSKSDSDLNEHKAKCQLYGDVGYDHTFWEIAYNYREHAVQDRDFESIRIYSNKDYSSDFPAGADLAPLYCLASRSPYKYIESGYTLGYSAESLDYPEYYHEYLKRMKGNIQFRIRDGVFPVFGVLSEMSPKDMKLLGFGDQWESPFEIMTLYPTCLPDDKAVHMITVELTDTAGEVLTASVDVDFSVVTII